MSAPAESSRFSQAIGLMAALAAAKLLSAAGRDLPVSVWLPPALLWQDVAVGLAFGVADAILRRPRLLWVPYALVVGYAAINVPIARVLSSPLTVPMWRAARGPLLDSITTYLTPINLLLIAAVIAVGSAGPFLASRSPVVIRRAVIVVAVMLLAAGPVAMRRIDVSGLHRNAVTTLVASAFPRVPARPGADDWRASPFGAGMGDDLTRLRGSMANRNVVIVILESTAAQYLASYGAKDDATPNLTALAKRSILFEHAYAVYPESIKGLFSLLCAQSPALDVPVEVHASAPCEPLPRLMNARGYRTGLFHSGRFMYLGMSDLLARQEFATLEDAGAIGGNVQSSFGVDEPSVVTRMLRWIDAGSSGQKFLLVYAPAAGHHPYLSPEPGPFKAGDDLGLYKNALHYGDRSLGVLLDGLRARGFGDTLVVVYGDHGEAFGQHDGNFGHSIFIYDENVRVPLVIGSLSGTEGIRVGRTASVIDITPTILDLLGLPASPRHEGTSLLEPGDRMALFYTDYTLAWLGLRDGCWKMLYEIESRRSRLFDVCTDPAERIDRSAAEPVRVAAYADRLQRWSAAQRAKIGRS